MEIYSKICQKELFKQLKLKQFVAPCKEVEGLKCELLDRIESQSYIENKRFEDDDDVLVTHPPAATPANASVAVAVVVLAAAFVYQR